jgi:hypothetical protein
VVERRTKTSTPIRWHLVCTVTRRLPPLGAGDFADPAGEDIIFALSVSQRLIVGPRVRTSDVVLGLRHGDNDRRT